MTTGKEIYEYIKSEYSKQFPQNDWNALTDEEKHYFAWEVCCKVNTDYHNSYSKFENFIVEEIMKEINDSKIHITRDSALAIIKSFIDKHRLNYVIHEEIGKPLIYVDGKASIG